MDSIRYSIIIVSHNRKEELAFTLSYLGNPGPGAEILVFLDGCIDGSSQLSSLFPWVLWQESEQRVGASMARSLLCKQAKGTYLIGFDDDSHPTTPLFLEETDRLFSSDSRIGIIAFNEIRGKNVQIDLPDKTEQYEVAEFIGCGFAVRKSVYDQTRGFPEWIDIYGEEACLSIEVLEAGYTILYTNTIRVHHRVDRASRERSGHNLFRFRKQLRNTSSYYLVYYRNPIVPLIRLHLHNFRKYAVVDWSFFTAHLGVVARILYDLPRICRFRRPVSKSTLLKIRNSRPMQF